MWITLCWRYLLCFQFAENFKKLCMDVGLHEMFLSFNQYDLLLIFFNQLIRSSIVCFLNAKQAWHPFNKSYLATVLHILNVVTLGLTTLVTDFFHINCKEQLCIFFYYLYFYLGLLRFIWFHTVSWERIPVYFLNEMFMRNLC